MSREIYLSIDEALVALVKLEVAQLKSWEAISVAESIALELVKSAVFEGDVATQKLLLERTSGRVGVVQKVEKDNALVEALQGMWGQK